MTARELYRHLWLTPFIHYPNVNNITDAINENKRAGILASLCRAPRRPRKAIVYLHIPFCTSHCTFCFYNIRLAKEGNPAFSNYVDALIAEIELYASTAYISGLQSEHVFIGGGTPSVLPAPIMARLLDAIKKNLFPDRPPDEFSVEFALQTMTEDRIQACKDHGVTRISYGWQTFSPVVRKRMGLIPTEQSLAECIKLLRSYDYAVNTDLIYGLPEQTRTDWAEDLKKAVDYGFDGIDAFPIQPVPPSPLYYLMRRKKISVASNEDLLTMLKLAINTLKSAGFIRSNFQRFHKPGVPTSQHKYNNAMFSTDHDVIALGAGAIGIMNDRVYMNIRDIDGYMTWRAAMASPMSCAASMDDKKWVERAFCLELPWLSKIRKDRLPAPVTDAQRKIIEELKCHGLMEETGDEYRLLEQADGYNFNIARSFVSTENRIRNEEYAESLTKEINWKSSVKSSFDRAQDHLR